MPTGSALLDSFNRSDGAPGSNWGIAVQTYNLPNIVSNELDWPQFPAAIWTPAMVSNQQYVWCELTGGAVEVQLLLRWKNPNTGGEEGYGIQGSNGGSFPAEGWKWQSGAASSMGFSNGIMSASDTFMLAEATGEATTTLRLYGSSDGVNWNLRQTWTDSTSPYTNAGQIGLHHPNNVVGGKINQFGGDAVVPNTPTTMDLSNFPKFLPAGRRTV